MVHLDLPKDIRTMRPICLQVFTKLEKCINCFSRLCISLQQSIIAFFEVLERKGIIKAEAIAASSIYYRIAEEMLGKEEWTMLMNESIKYETELVKTAAEKYRKYPTAALKYQH